MSFVKQSRIAKKKDAFFCEFRIIVLFLPRNNAANVLLYMKDVELVTALSKEMNMSPKEVMDTLSAFFLLIGDTLSNSGSVSISGLGQFEAKKKAERISVNPVNGKRYLIPPKITPVYKPAASWKTYLKKLDENE
ncbi:MAG: HU family DNA-binding protein [Tannerella sp.]|nr:HU family DNA-binding protein [Tannerella sp.]